MFRKFEVAPQARGEGKDASGQNVQIMDFRRLHESGLAGQISRAVQSAARRTCVRSCIVRFPDYWKDFEFDIETMAFRADSFETRICDPRYSDRRRGGYPEAEAARRKSKGDSFKRVGVEFCTYPRPSLRARTANE